MLLEEIRMLRLTIAKLFPGRSMSAFWAPGLREPAKVVLADRAEQIRFGGSFSWGGFHDLSLPWRNGRAAIVRTLCVRTRGQEAPRDTGLWPVHSRVQSKTGVASRRRFACMGRRAMSRETRKRGSRWRPRPALTTFGKLFPQHHSCSVNWPRMTISLSSVLFKRPICG